MTNQQGRFKNGIKIYAIFVFTISLAIGHCSFFVFRSANEPTILKVYYTFIHPENQHQENEVETIILVGLLQIAKDKGAKAITDYGAGADFGVLKNFNWPSMADIETIITNNKLICQISETSNFICSHQCQRMCRKRRRS